MGTRDINEYLSSGEVQDVKKGGTTDADTLKDKAEIQALILETTGPIDARVLELEEGHTTILSGVSTLASQAPTALDTPLQLTYGPAQEVPGAEIHLSSTGVITFNKAGKYVVNFRAHYGRTGASGTSILMFRVLKNGVAQGHSFAAKMSSADDLIPWDSSSFIVDAQIGDTLVSQIIRDSAGVNFGGVFQIPSTAAGWAAAPCAAVSVYKV